MTKEDYIKAQANCGIKVGDEVRIFRKAIDNENGWNDSWVGSMDNYIGASGTVTKIDTAGIEVKVSMSIAFSYPYFVLQKLNNMEHKITTENILAAADKCPQAKETLKTLFPEAFEKEKHINLYTSAVAERAREVYCSDDSEVIIRVGNGLVEDKNLRDKCFHLKGACNWELKKEGYDYILIPTRK